MVALKKKPYKSALSNGIWSFRGMLKDSPKSFAVTVLEVPANIALAWAGVYLPALVVSLVTSQVAISSAALRIGILIGLMLLVAAVQTFCNTMTRAYFTVYQAKRQIEVDKKSMSCLYQDYEKKQIRDLNERAFLSVQMWNGRLPIIDMPKSCLKLIENVICYCLFGTVISFASLWLVLVLTAAPAVNWLCARAYRNWEYSNREKWTDIGSKLQYIRNKPSDFAAAKDIRIYSLAGWFKQLYQDYSQKYEQWDRAKSFRLFLSRLADLLIILLRDGVGYAVLIGMFLDGKITVDQFVLYFAAISTFATYVGNIMEQWNKIHEASLFVSDFREYMDLPEHDGTGEEAAEAHLYIPAEITFDNVCYRYDGSEEDTLKNISCIIRPGEKVALVGLNGAGKTTLVKLLCGLYLPTSGDIRINGVSIRKFKRESYYRLFAPVFQDAQPGFFSLAETVTGQLGDCKAPERVEQCLRLAGLGQKLDSLPKGIHTMLDKQVNQDGIELSGGELQKLMLARALYKNAPVLVLDEPTAALDPIAEHEIYTHYHSMTLEKTALFISHRLASTQFCDRILYLQDGKILEEGSHEELLTLGGEYSRLYEMQSCWYREDYKGGAET